MLLRGPRLDLVGGGKFGELSQKPFHLFGSVRKWKSTSVRAENCCALQLIQLRMSPPMAPGTGSSRAAGPKAARPPRRALTPPDHSHF